MKVIKTQVMKYLTTIKWNLYKILYKYKLIKKLTKNIISRFYNNNTDSHRTP